MPKAASAPKILIPGKASRQNQNFAHKSVQTGQADGGKRDDKKSGGKHRAHVGESAKIGNHPRVPAVIDHPDKKEERSGG